LKERFGEDNQSGKYRLELKSRRRRPNETLRNLYSDIRRLFGHPTARRSCCSQARAWSSRNNGMWLL